MLEDLFFRETGLDLENLCENRSGCILLPNLAVRDNKILNTINYKLKIYLLRERML
jgi:hypothetical protein